MKLPELKTWQSILLGILFGAVILSAALLISLPDRMAPLVILPTVTIAPIQVHITGEVKNPGVVQVLIDSRIQDVIISAGGVTDNADLGQINLAAKVTDGQKIVIPVLGDTSSKKSIQVQNASTEEIPKISLNSATQKELEKLPGIGEEKAKDIITEREKRGRFQTIEELSSIPGFSQNLITQIRPFLFID